MHSWISQLVLKMEIIDLDHIGHFGHFDSEFEEFRFVCAITFNRFELELPKLHQICILGFSQLVLKMGGIELDLQGHLAISTHKTAFNVALVHWSRPAKGYYTSQACSCIIYLHCRLIREFMIMSVCSWWHMPWYPQIWQVFAWPITW